MFSRAHLLIEKEIQKIHTSPPWGVDIQQVSDGNFFEWMAKIQGLKGTAWEGGVFQIYIKFDEHFNVRPPEICFQTIPFHPNVDMTTGRPCVDYLDNFDLWQTNFSLSMILVTLQVLLSSPIVDNAVNTEAAKLMTQSPQAYIQMVLQCVAASQQIEAGMSPQQDDGKVKFAEPVNHTCIYTPFPASNDIVHTTKLSFDDYLKTWRTIATTKPGENWDIEHMICTDLQVLQGKSLEKSAKRLIPEELKLKVMQHKKLVYGCFHAKGQPKEDLRLARIDYLKNIYFPPKTSTPPLPNSLKSSAPASAETKDWEKEADDLVDWSNNLDADSIDL